MRFARCLLVCISGLLLPSATAAQQPPPVTAAPPSSSELQGPVRTLTIEDAVELALRNNLGLQIERLNPLIEDESIAQARAPYSPTLNSSFSLGGSKNLPGDFTEGSAAYTNDNLTTNLSFTQQSLPWSNASLQATWQGSRGTTGRRGPSFNPQLGSFFNVRANQPLLRNFLVNPVRNQIEQAVISRQIADIALRQRVVGVERNVRQAYWSLVGAIERLKVARQNLELSQEQLRANKVRVEVGTMAPIEIIAAQAEVAGNEEAVITAEAAIRASEDNLRMLIFDPAAPDFWTARIQPANPPLLQPLEVDTEAAIRAALEARTDIINARRQLQIADLNLELTKNQTLPDVSVSANVTGAGSGGTQFTYINNNPELGIASERSRTFRQTLGDVFGFVYPNWSVGVNFSYPLGKAAAEASHARASLQRRQNDAQLKNLELSIVQQVRAAARNVTSNFQRVQSTRIARELAEQRYEAQRKRFDVGLSTQFELTQAQRDVVFQRNNELNAVIAYNQALVDFQVVQVAPLGGGF
jgi:outer membrane protein